MDLECQIYIAAIAVFLSPNFVPMSNILVSIVLSWVLEQSSLGDKNKNELCLFHRCSRCDLRLKTKEELTDHKKKHDQCANANNPFHCVLCSQVFVNSSRLKRHVTNCHTDFPKCPHCPKRSYSPYSIKVHIARCHLQEKRYENTHWLVHIFITLFICFQFESFEKLHPHSLDSETMNP